MACVAFVRGNVVARSTVASRAFVKFDVAVLHTSLRAPLPSPTTYWHKRVRGLSGSRRNSNDPFVVLGVDRGASKQQLTAAYHALALQYHPDRKPGDTDAEARFREIAAAYQAACNGGHTNNVGARSGDGGVVAAEEFAAVAGLTLEEAERLFRSIFGADTLQDISNTTDRLESLRRRVEHEVLERHPRAERATHEIIVGTGGKLLLRTTAVIRDGGIESHEREVSPEEAREFVGMGAEVIRVTGKAVCDVATTVAATLAREVTRGIAAGLVSCVSSCARQAVEMAAPVLPRTPKHEPTISHSSTSSKVNVEPILPSQK